jgi:hypothetical protein
MRPILCSRVSIAAAVLALGSLPAGAQEPPVEASAPQAGIITRAIGWTSRLAANSSDGFYPELGHMVPGAGLIKGGPGYRHHFADGRVLVNATAAASLRRYSMARTSIVWPAAFNSRVELAGGLSYEDSTQVNYFGVGPRTTEGAETDYRIKSLDLSGAARVPLTDRVAIVGSGGMLTGLSVDRALSDLVPSIEQRFDALTAPGLTATPRYAHVDIGVERDSRDTPGYATRGGLYRLTASAFHDAGSTGQSFRHIDADAIRYVPLMHDRAGLSVHGRLMLSQTSAGNVVPFYLLPTLGGGDTLRGYADYRFRDRHAALLNLEYRWRVFMLMDAAVFMDVGTVAASTAALLHNPRSHDYGAGIRLHSERRALGRLDLARSPEGVRVVFSVTAPFNAVRRRSVVPFVP